MIARCSRDFISWKECWLLGGSSTPLPPAPPARESIGVGGWVVSRMSRSLSDMVLEQSAVSNQQSAKQLLLLFLIEGLR
jgi:hypothetical protein